MKFLRSRHARSASIRNSRRQQLRRANLTEKLETREMLVGQVAAVVRGNNLFLTGDNSSNQVEVAFNDGNVAVRPRNGTRINGVRGDFVAFENTDTVPGSIFVNMRQGDDTVIVSTGIRVTRDVRVKGHQGADTLALDDVVVRDDVYFTGGSGDDRVSIENSRIVGETKLKMRTGDDLVRIVTADLRGILTVRGSQGDDSAVLDDVDVDGKIRIRMNQGDDTIDIQNLRADLLLRVDTHGGDDTFVMDDSVLRGRTSINLGADDDEAVLGDGDGGDSTPSSGNIFQRSLRIVGRTGVDDLRIDVDNTFRSRRIESRFEGDAPIGDTSTATGGADALADDISELISTPDPVPDPEPEPDPSDRELTASVDTSDDDTQEIGSGDTLTFTTTDDIVTITGQVDDDAELEVDTNGDGQFDDATTIADESGNFSISVPLVAGPQTVDIRNADQIDEIASFNVDRIDGTIIRMTTSLGNIDVQLYEDDFPITTANFQSYFDRYGESMFIHRSPADFVIQGGGFTIDGTTVGEVEEFANITNEFNSGNESNVAGTLSMALSGGDPNSGNSQWFINITDNVSLDNVPHTVFGALVGGANGPSMEVARAINDLEIFNIATVSGQGALTETPLQNYEPFVDLIGTVTLNDGSQTVTGSGTQFNSQVDSGDRITINGTTFTVDEVTSDTALTVTTAASEAFANEDATIEPIPDASNYVVFSEITELTDGLNDL